MSPPVEYLDGRVSLPLLGVRSLLSASDEALLAVAYVRQSGVGLVDNEIKAMRKRGGRVRVLTTFDFGLTQPAALEALMDRGVEVKVAQFRDRAYHPKVYLGRGGRGPRAVVGSSNLTAAGLTRNVEGSVLVTGADAAAVQKRAWGQFDDLWDSAAAVDCPRGLKIPKQPRLPRQIIDLLPKASGLGDPMTFRDSQSVPTDDEEFEEVWAEILHAAKVGRVFLTATGQPNTVLQADALAGLLLATNDAPAGKWVPPDMFERVIAAVGGLGELPLNAPEGSGLLGATRGLRVYRSSAVFAVLGALSRYELVRRPRVVLRVAG